MVSAAADRKSDCRSVRPTLTRAEEDYVIDVPQRKPADPAVFEVTVSEGGGRTRHDVTARAADLARLGGAAKPETVVAAAFRFLLDREPKEAILRSFDLTVIGRYFPEFERQLPDYLRAGPR